MSIFETLPEITDRQYFICEEGHGECTPVEVHFGPYTSWVSDCCQSGICVWDNDKDDVVIT